MLLWHSILVLARFSRRSRLLRVYLRSNLLHPLLPRSLHLCFNFFTHRHSQVLGGILGGASSLRLLTHSPGCLLQPYGHLLWHLRSILLPTHSIMLPSRSKLLQIGRAHV